MRSAVLVACLMACGSRSDPPPPPPPSPRPPAIDAEAPDEPEPAMKLDEAKIAADQAQRLRKAYEREAGVPARKACTASCDLANDPRAKSDCAETAPGVLVLGGMEHIACYSTEVIIDCCPAIQTDNLAAVMAALGWKAATIEQRRAIGWLVLRAVLMRPIVEEVSDDFPTPAKFTPPSASLANNEVTLDYWSRTYLHPRFFHRQAVFHADGTLTTNELEELKVDDDPQLRRRQAIEAAKKAGILPGSGSAK